MLASELEIAGELGRLAKKRQLSVMQPKKNIGYTVIKADGPILKNAISIWDGKLTFYTDDKTFLDALGKSGYSVLNRPYRAEPSGTYRYEFADITLQTLTQAGEHLVAILRKSSDFVAGYRTRR